MTTLNVSLPDEIRDFLASQVASGSYQSADEYLSDLLRREQRHQAQSQARQQLEASLLQGLNSGEPVEATPAYWADLRQQARARA